MENSSTQLPAEAAKKINDTASFHAGHNENEDTTPYRSGFFYGYIKGATEYAIKLHEEQQATEDKIDKALHAERNKMQKRVTESETEWAVKLHQAQQEIKELKQWKSEATELLSPILDYGQSKEAGIPLGERITEVVLDRCRQAETARALLEKFISRHEAGLLPDRFIYNEIKTFLDETK